MTKHGAFQTRAGQNPAARSALSRYQSISVDISRYQSISVDISRYQSVSVDISRYQSISVDISLYQSISVDISRYQSISVDISRYQSISVDISRYQSISVDISRYQSISVDISRYQSISVDISRYQSISVDISRYQSISVDISRYQSISVDIVIIPAGISAKVQACSSNCLATCTCYESHRKRMQLRTAMFGTRDATCPCNNFCTPRAKGHRRWAQTGQTQSRLHPPIAPSPQRWFQTGVWEGTPNSSPCPWSCSKFHSEESKIQCNSHISRHGAQAESSMNFQIGIPSSSTCPCSHNNCHSEGNKRQCGSRYSTLHVARRNGRNGRNGLRLVQRSHSSRSTTWFHAELEVLPRLMPNRTEAQQW